MKKISILIPSRNRPRQLSAVITALHEMESGENEVEYRAGWDLDDEPTRKILIDSGAHSIPTDESTITIGGIWNSLANWNDADIYSCMIDDAFPITPHWDKVMVAMAERYYAFSWHEVSAPWNVGYPTCTKEWLKNCGYIVPEHFPYWFMDTWFAELVQFTTGQDVPMTPQMALFSKQEVTQNLRELSFWWGFFNATRGLRLKKAHSMLAEPVEWEQFVASRKVFIDRGNARDMEFRGKRIEELERERGSKGEPSQKYILAKQRAEAYLQEHGLKIWGGLDAC